MSLISYPHVKRDYFRADLTLTERKRCVNGKACKKKRTRRLDKHKTVRYIYLTVKDSIGRSQGPVVADTMLLILSGRRHWTPKGVVKRDQKQKRLLATTNWPVGLL